MFVSDEEMRLNAEPQEPQSIEEANALFEKEQVQEPQSIEEANARLDSQASEPTQEPQSIEEANALLSTERPQEPQQPQEPQSIEAANAEIATAQSQADFAKATAEDAANGEGKPSMGWGETAAKNFEAQTGFEAAGEVNPNIKSPVDKFVLNTLSNMQTGVAKSFAAGQMLAAQGLSDGQADRPDGTTDRLLARMIYGTVGGTVASWFSTPDVLEEWDNGEGKKYKDPAERTRARNAFAAEIARQFILDRTQTQTNAALELQNREKSFGADAYADFGQNVGYMTPYMLGPAGIAAQFLMSGWGKAEELASDQYAFDEDGNLTITANGDSTGAAIAKGFTRAGIETGVEVVGGRVAGAVMKGLGGKVLKMAVGKFPIATEVAGRIAATKVGQAVANVTAKLNKFASWTSKKLHLEGLPEEYFEEWLDPTLAEAFGVERRGSEQQGTSAAGRVWEAQKEFFTAENQQRLVTSLILLQGAGQFAAWMDSRHQMKVVDDYLKKNGLMTDEQIASATTEEKAAAMDAHVQGMDEGEVKDTLDKTAETADAAAKSMERETAEKEAGADPAAADATAQKERREKVSKVRGAANVSDQVQGVEDLGITDWKQAEEEGLVERDAFGRLEGKARRALTISLNATDNLKAAVKSGQIDGELAEDMITAAQCELGGKPKDVRNAFIDGILDRAGGDAALARQMVDRLAAQERTAGEEKTVDETLDEIAAQVKAESIAQRNGVSVEEGKEAAQTAVETADGEMTTLGAVVDAEGTETRATPRKPETALDGVEQANRLQGTRLRATGDNLLTCETFKSLQVRVDEGGVWVSGLSADMLQNPDNAADAAAVISQLARIAQGNGLRINFADKDSADMAAALAREVNRQGLERTQKKLDLRASLLDVLLKTELSANVTTDEKSFADALAQTSNGSQWKDSHDNIYGFVDRDGNLHLNPRVLDFDTPIHEYGHLALEAVRKVNKTLWQRGMDLIRESEYFAAVKKASQTEGHEYQYLNGRDDAIADEALATMIGDRGAKLVESRGVDAKLKAWIKEVWSAFKSAFGIADLTEEQIETMTLDQFVDVVNAELLKGSEFGARKRAPSQSSVKAYDESSGDSNGLYRWANERGCLFQLPVDMERTQPGGKVYFLNDDANVTDWIQSALNGVDLRMSQSGKIYVKGQNGLSGDLAVIFGRYPQIGRNDGVFSAAAGETGRADYAAITDPQQLVDALLADRDNYQSWKKNGGVDSDVRAAEERDEWEKKQAEDAARVRWEDSGMSVVDYVKSRVEEGDPAFDLDWETAKEIERMREQDALAESDVVPYEGEVPFSVRRNGEARMMVGDLSKTLSEEAWGDLNRKVQVVGKGQPQWKSTRGRPMKDAKGEIAQLAADNLKAQKNYMEVGEAKTPALKVGETIFRIPLRNLFHGAARNIKSYGQAAARIGDIINASVEIPNVKAPWHYYIAAVDFGTPGYAFVTATENGDGTRNVVSMQTLYSVNVKTRARSTARGVNHTNASRLDVDIVSNLRAAWQEAFLPGIEKHNAEKSELKMSVRHLYTGSAADYEKPSLHAVDGKIIDDGLFVFNPRTEEAFAMGETEQSAAGLAAGIERAEAMRPWTAKDSPAAKAGPIAFDAADLVMFWRAVSGSTRNPHVQKGERIKGRKSAVGLNVGGERIEIVSRLFGVLDKGDVAKIREEMKSEGYFQNENPMWNGRRSRLAISREVERSQGELDRRIRELYEQRVRTGEGGGHYAAQVLGHEIGHTIATLPRDKPLGPVGDSLKTLFDVMNRAFQKEASPLRKAGDRTVDEETRSLIAWWHGQETMPEYYEKPTERFAELFGIFLTQPKSVAQMAPKTYEKLVQTVAQNEKLARAYQKVTSLKWSGKSTDAFMEKVRETWSAEAQEQYRQLVAKSKESISLKRDWFCYALNDRFGPMFSIAKRGIKAARELLEKAVREGAMSREEADDRIAAQNAEVDSLKTSLYDWQRQSGGATRLMIAGFEGVKAEAEKDGVDWSDVRDYAHCARVIELGGRATAHGGDPAKANAALDEMRTRIGEEGFAKVQKTWNAFRAVYERSVLEDPNVKELFDAATHKMLMENKHYVTMRHRMGVEETAEWLEKIDEYRRANPDAVDPILDMAGRIHKTIGAPGEGSQGFVLHRLVGSFEATEDPLAATIRRAVEIKESAARNHLLKQMSETLRACKVKGVFDLTDGKPRAADGKVYGKLKYMLDGQAHELIVPAVIFRQFNTDSTGFGKFGEAMRFIRNTMTLWNPAFINRAYLLDKNSLETNIEGLHKPVVDVISEALCFRGIGVPLYMVNNYLARFTPIANTWLGRIIWNEHTVNHYAHRAQKIARIVYEGKFAERLAEAQGLREKGLVADAAEIEQNVEVARDMMKRNVFQSQYEFNREQAGVNTDDILASYGYRLEGGREPTTLRGKAWEKAKAAGRFWNRFEEEQEACTKIIAYLYQMKADEAAGRTGEADAEARARLVIEQGGTPNLAARGVLATYIENATGFFWNVRKEGAMRTIRAAKDHPAEWFSKNLAQTAAPALLKALMLTGGLEAIVRAFFDDDDEKIRESWWAPAVLEHSRWTSEAMKCIPGYYQRNYNMIPLAKFGDEVLSMRVKYSPEEFAIQSMIHAAFQKFGIDPTDPSAGWSELTAGVWNEFFPNIFGRNYLFDTVGTIVGPLIGVNPTDMFRDRKFYDEDTWKARGVNAHTAAEIGKQFWNYSPLGTFTATFKNGQERKLEDSEVPAWLDKVLSTPLVRMIPASMLTVTSKDSYLKGLKEKDDEHRALARIKARDVLAESIKRGSLGGFQEGLKDLPPELQKVAIRYVMNGWKQYHADPKAKQYKQVRAIKDPQLKNRAMKWIEDGNRYQD